MALDEKLYAAIARGDSATVNARLETGCSAASSDSDGITALMHAVLVENARPEIVEMLIRAGADVSAKDKRQQWTALAFAARDGKVDACRSLLSAGADIEAVDAFGNSPVWRAAMANHVDVVRLLVQNGADLDRANRRGVTARSILGTGFRLDGAG